MIRFYAFLGAIGAFLAAIIGIFTAGKRQARTTARLDELKKDLEAHARINEADDGRLLTDEQRRVRLAKLAREWDRDRSSTP